MRAGPTGTKVRKKIRKPKNACPAPFHKERLPPRPGRSLLLPMPRQTPPLQNVTLTLCLSVPLRIRLFAGRRADGRKKRILAGLAFSTPSPENRFRLTDARGRMTLCAQKGHARRPTGHSASFLTFRQKAFRCVNKRKKRRKARLRPPCRPFFPGVAEEHPRLCAQIRASLRKEKVFLPHCRPHLCAKKPAFLRKNS